MRRFDPRWQRGNFEQNADAADELVTIAGKAGVTVSQLALAWLLS